MLLLLLSMILAMTWGEFWANLPDYILRAATLATALVAAWKSIQAADHSAKDRVETAGVKSDVQKIHVDINDRITQLVAASASAAHGEGYQAGQLASAATADRLATVEAGHAGLARTIADLRDQVAQGQVRETEGKTREDEGKAREQALSPAPAQPEHGAF